ncbi:MAG: serine hydrolase domain-containing protein [Hyphomonas sp.]|uniref:serine hydrolase domain-containing protein n=1 Tax=Hyphomonas sp. TaxID=87 RepID=UPI0034A01522
MPAGHADTARGRIDALVASGNVPAAGLVVVRNGETIFAHAAGLARGAAGESPPLPFETSTMMRVASVSKLATALTAHRLAEAGAIDLDADISKAFKASLRHPAFPDSEVTLRHLLSHTAGLEDPDAYWIASPQPIDALFVPGMWRAAAYGPPGAGFRYSNFGYGLAGTLLERASGERFDRLAQRLVLGPIGLSAGFNWSGVRQADQARGASLYRREGARWQIATDGPGVLDSGAPQVMLEAGFPLASYSPGTNGTLFSPQGGLRASLADLCRLARETAKVGALVRPSWRSRPDPRNGDTEDGYFAAFSEGAQIHESQASPLPGFELIGHPGEAYNLFCGAWHVPRLGAQFAYAVTGTPDATPAVSDLHPSANIFTAALFSAARDVLRV